MRRGDTSFFIDLFDPERVHHADPTQWYESHADQPLFAPAIVNWELYRGAVRVSDEYAEQL